METNTCEKLSVDERRECANTILSQLTGASNGAARLVAMIGAWAVTFGNDDDVSFRFKARAQNGANMCRIKLDPSNTYTVEFISFRGSQRTLKGIFKDVYNDSLKELFEHETGLRLNL